MAPTTEPREWRRAHLVQAQRLADETGGRRTSDTSVVIAARD